MTPNLKSTNLDISTEKLIDYLATIEHYQWAHWTKYMLDNLSEKNIERWRRQIDTPYNELNESEKEADRKWARKVIDCFDSSIFVLIKRKELKLIRETIREIKESVKYFIEIANAVEHFIGKGIMIYKEENSYGLGEEILITRYKTALAALGLKVEE